MKESTRRKLLKRLAAIAAALGGVYVAPNAWAIHKCGHQGSPPCSLEFGLRMDGRQIRTLPARSLFATASPCDGHH